ncbi:TPA: hypothetical protein N0F65_003222 [Lagenidium giganteum]|uniref:Uncharacterized protein n=1 Tax=Lagenidium giganteum TaxID=4803 RepID=A0AAV2ZC33_9STRA|nr:TPA: hypothetical protein N0F65_003222 [Lagenidium giganteum]
MPQASSGASATLSLVQPSRSPCG